MFKMRTHPYISDEEEVFEMKQNLCDFLSCLLIRKFGGKSVMY